MNSLQLNINEQLKKVLDIIIRISDPDKVILFGSRARGVFESDSDYDILVLKRGVKKLRKLAREIYLNFAGISVSVDLLVYDTDKFEEIKDYPFRIYYTINLEGKVIYEKAG